MVLLVIKKNRPAWQGAALAALLGVFGIAVVALLWKRLSTKEAADIEERDVPAGEQAIELRNLADRQR